VRLDPLYYILVELTSCTPYSHATLTELALSCIGVILVAMFYEYLRVQRLRLDAHIRRKVFAKCSKLPKYTTSREGAAVLLHDVTTMETDADSAVFNSNDSM
jgi:ABC-type protease/lipase transport system fused ATPase/permease subunit